MSVTPATSTTALLLLCAVIGAAAGEGAGGEWASKFMDYEQAHGWWAHNAEGDPIPRPGGLQPKPKLPALPLVTGPNVNGIELRSNFSATDQPLAERGFLDVTKPPFSADPSGKIDATAAIQAAVLAARSAYLVVLLPKGSTFLVSKTIAIVQPEKAFLSTVGSPGCNNMDEVFGSPLKHVVHCARTAPVMVVGEPVASGARPTLRVAANAGFSGPVVYLHNPINENVNMNQVLSGVDIEIAAGNPQAIGAYGRAAQGTSIQDVTVRCADCAVGIQGGAGSGGSHINVRVEGGKLGLDLAQSQPSPTITGVTLINQTVTAISYGNPGRQTLSVTGALIQLAPSASGPAISALAQALSLVDSVIEGHAHQVGVDVSSSSNLFLQDVYFRGFEKSVVMPDGSVLGPSYAASRSATWSHAKLVAGGRQKADPEAAGPAYTSPVFKNGSATDDYQVNFVTPSNQKAQPSDLTSRHVWDEATFPSWFDSSACRAKDFGAKGDLVTDDTASLQKMLDSPKCSVLATLDKGYYALSKTLQMKPGQALLGVSRVYSNLVPHSSLKFTIQPGEKPMPLLRTATGAADKATIGMLSVLVWRHMNSTSAVSFEAGNTLWRRAHTNRIDLSPGKIAPYAYYNHPLNSMTGHGGGQFWNFYQENWDSQGPLYRHLLVSGTDRPWSCYHCNTEHSQGEANLEISGTSAPIKIHGFKAEGNYAQIWVRDAAEFWLQGYGGNASPFPFNCPYPPGYTQYPPTLLRVERTPKLLIANVITQVGNAKNSMSKCGIFDTGFAGTFYDAAHWRSVLEVTAGGNFSTAPLLWPVLYVRGSLE